MILLGFQCVRPDTFKSTPFSAAVSVCVDYCDHLPDTWCLDWVSSREFPGDFSHAEAQAIIEECTESFGRVWEWPDLMTDEAWARSFHARWAASRGYRLVAIACAPHDRERLANAMRPPPQQPGFSPNGALGIQIMAECAQSLNSRWPVLGWEVLEANSATVGDCHGASVATSAVTGLMPTYEEARALADDLQTRPDRSAWHCHIPIAIVAVSGGE